MRTVPRAEESSQGGDAKREGGPFSSSAPNECAVGEVIAHSLVAHAPYAPLASAGHCAPLPLRVLIADDYADAAESLSLLLSCVGIETQIARDGEEALARAGTWHPHICVLDIGMPKLDGRELARRIRAQSWIERPLLIALTGWTTAQDRQSALDAGFDHYLTKPADPVKLVRIIQTCLSGRLT